MQANTIRRCALSEGKGKRRKTGGYNLKETIVGRKGKERLVTFLYPCYASVLVRYKDEKAREEGGRGFVLKFTEENECSLLVRDGHEPFKVKSKEGGKRTWMRTFFHFSLSLSLFLIELLSMNFSSSSNPSFFHLPDLWGTCSFHKFLSVNSLQPLSMMMMMKRRIFQILNQEVNFEG